MQTSALEIIRWLHIVAGSFALLAGPVAMFNQNGGQTHRISGKIYFWSMVFIFASSIIMSLAKNNLFLFMIGIFSFYLVITAYRALHLKNLHKGQKAELFDWVVLWLSALAGTGLAVFGLYVVFMLKNSFGLVALVFGAVMLQGVKTDYRRFTVPPKEKNHWLLKHITGMMGGYIATFTAFLVNNWQSDPPFISWLLPTLVISPFITLTLKKFKKGKGRIELPS